MCKKLYVFNLIIALLIAVTPFISCGGGGGGTTIGPITAVDTDGDGVSDGVLIDADGNGIYEGIDTDGNGQPDINFADSNNNNNINAPDSPSGIIVTVSSGQVILSWNAVNNALSYNIYWSNSPGVTKNNGHKIGGVPSQFTHSGLTNGSTYYYVITAVNSAGESAVSTEISGKPVLPEVPSTAVTAPSGVTAVSVLNQVSLSWTEVSGASYYNIYWGYSSGVTPSTGNKIAGISGTSYTHLNLANGTAYYYIVTAVGVSGESSASVQAGATSQVPAPVNLQTSSGDSEITISWNSVPGVSSYSIYWSLSPTVSSGSNKISNVTSGYTHSGLTNGLTYYYAVVSNNSGSESVLSSVISTIPQLEVTVATAVFGHDNEFNLNTANNSNVSRYTINGPSCVISDGAGGIYVADFTNNRVLHFATGALYADRIYGQLGSSITTTSNRGGISANSLSSPAAVAIDALGVYIADRGNNRVLYYPGTSTTATRVYGQGGSFSNGLANSGGPVSADSLSSPYGVTADSAGVYICDTSNNRVLYFSGTDTTADRVYGQNGIYTTAIYATRSANSLYQPMGVALDNSGIYIADSLNNRVLYFPGTNTTADRVYGQTLFTTFTSNNGGLSASSLSTPRGVAVDSADGLYISDTSNNRVLYYDTTDTTADRVYGQASFNLNTVPGVPSDTSLSIPCNVAVVAAGIYIADQGNSRVLFYAGTGTTSTIAFGPVYDDTSIFTVPTANYSGLTKDSLYYCSDVVTDSTGGAYIADILNNRVLYFPAGSTTATRVYGQKGSFTSSNPNKGGIGADTLYYPNSVAVNGSGVYIADTNNNRVLYYEGTSTTASRVYGQLGSMISSTGNNGGLSDKSLYDPVSVTVSSSGIYIVDSLMNRILFFEGTSTTASRVYGQAGSFTTGTLNKNGISADSLYITLGLGNGAGDVAVAAEGIYIADTYNNRVLFYPGDSTTATRVYGQYIFTAATANYGGIHAESLNNPYCVAVDSSDNLYISDTANNRVLYYPLHSTIATRVYGQGGSYAVGTANNGGVSATSLRSPRGLYINTEGTLYVAEIYNNRVLKY